MKTGQLIWKLTNYEYSAQDYAIADTGTNNHDVIATVHITGDDQYDKVVPPKWRDLFVAAPELLAACELLMRAEDMQKGARGRCVMGEISQAIDAAREAIKKAKGEA